MLWFLIAVITHVGTTEPSYQYNRHVQFSTLEQCVDFTNKYGDKMRASLKMTFPTIEKINNIMCIDTESAQELQRHLIEKRKGK